MPKLIICRSFNKLVEGSKGNVQSLASKSHPLEYQTRILHMDTSSSFIEQVKSDSPKFIHVTNRMEFESSNEVPKIRKNFFPLRLMNTLNNHRFVNSLHWSDDGRSFIIKDTFSFSQKVLCKTFYKNENVSSFIRKLHRWGFRRTIRGYNKHQFYHPLFMRDTPSLCKGMMCTSKQARMRRLSSLNSKEEFKKTCECSERLNSFLHIQEG